MRKTGEHVSAIDRNFNSFICNPLFLPEENISNNRTAQLLEHLNSLPKWKITNR